MTDTSPKRLRELADWLVANGWTAAAEKESPGPVCPTCGSDCNERDELIKAEREIESLTKQAAAYRNLLTSLEEQRSHLRRESSQARESIETLNSEREANAILTEEIERLRAEAQQRERMNARFANRAPSPPTADFDLPHESDDAAGHAEQHPEMAKPADVPLPEHPPADRNDEVNEDAWSLDLLLKYGQVCAKAARDAAFDECAHICEKVSDQLGDGTRIETAAEGGAYQCVIAIKAAKGGAP